MKKNQKLAGVAFRWALFCGIAATSLVGCKDYDDDIDNLNNKVDGLQSSVESLLADIKAGKFVKNIEATADGTGIKVTFSDDQSKEIAINGKAAIVKVDENGNLVDGDGKIIVKAEDMKGEPGETPRIGENGNWWIGQTDTKVPASGVAGEGNTAYIVEDEANGFYVLNVWNKEANKYVEVKLPMTTSVVTDVVFIPYNLSSGEAKRIHFPTIVTDSVAGTKTIAGNEWSESNYKDFDIIYSGKGEFKYQINPQSVAFDEFEVVGFARDTAEIWNYNTNDKKWMLFDAGQKFYTDGKLTADSYKEGKGMLNFRAKDWAFAEQNNLSDRTVYSLVVKNGDNMIHSEFIPAKHEVILQKNVYLVKKESDATKPDYTVATAPNTNNYRAYIKDEYYQNKLNPATLDEYQANKAAVEANAENQLYKGTEATSKADPRIHVEILYKDETKDLKKDVLAFFNKRAGRDAAAEYILDENGFDDYKLIFEPVDFYYDGVNQTKRYLNITQDGIASVRLNSDWGEVTQDHTAAIDRTPIVRVKLVAPGEDNNKVVKTAIIKLLIVKKSTPTEDIVITQEKNVVLKHINQDIDMDMDQIFFHSGVQMSKDEFRDTYDFVAKPGTTEADNYVAVSLADAIVTGQEYNQLVVTVKNTAFSSDHVVYHVKGQYEPKQGKNAPIVKIDYTINVKYPEVPALERTSMYWDGDVNYAYGKYAEYPVEANGDTYKMEAVLSNLFTPYNYPAYTGTTADDARVTLSYELVDLHNDASDVAGTPSGVKVVQRLKPGSTTETEWVIELENNDLGRSYIFNNEKELKGGKTIKVRAVASFNECVDGLYGTCTADADGIHKYNKSRTAEGINGKLFGKEICATHTPSYGATAPELGRYKVIEEFEIKFIDPIQFTTKKVDPLHDKYVNKVDLFKGFTLGEYLYNGALGNNSYVIFDKDLAGKSVEGINTNPATVTFDANGWNPILTSEFVVEKTLHFTIKGYKHADGTDVVLGDNKDKFQINNDPNSADYGKLIWDNTGENITKEFNIEVEVCVNHKWGQVCGHEDWKPTDKGHSVGTIIVPVKKWNDPKE